LMVSVEALLMVILGGTGSLIGPFLGAVILVFMKNYLSIYVGRWLMILGATYILTVLFIPKGIYGGLGGFFQRLWWLRQRRSDPLKLQKTSSLEIDG